ATGHLVPAENPDGHHTDDVDTVDRSTPANGSGDGLLLETARTGVDSGLLRGGRTGAKVGMEERKPHRNRGRVIGLIAAALVLCAAIAWATRSGNQVQAYVSPPLDTTGTRLHILYPSGWIVRPQQKTQLTEGLRYWSV